MILFPDTSYDDSLQAITIDGNEYIRIDHMFEPGSVGLTIFGGTCQEDTGNTSSCPTIELAGGSDEIARLIAGARVHLFNDIAEKRIVFLTEADFCLRYRDCMSGTCPDWRFHMLYVHLSKLELYYADAAGGFEIIEIPEFNKLTVSVPSDLQTFQVVKHRQDDIRVFTQVGGEWSPAVSIQQNPVSTDGGHIISRYYPMSLLRDGSALKAVFDRVTDDGALYW